VTSFNCNYDTQTRPRTIGEWEKCTTSFKHHSNRLKWFLWTRLIFESISKEWHITRISLNNPHLKTLQITFVKEKKVSCCFQVQITKTDSSDVSNSWKNLSLFRNQHNKQFNRSKQCSKDAIPFSHSPWVKGLLRHSDRSQIRFLVDGLQ